MDDGKSVAAAVHVAPVPPLDATRTVEIVCTKVREASEEGARLVVFPECFVPRYPNGSVDLGNPNEWAVNLREFTRHALTVPRPEVDRIADVARECGAYVVVGVNETYPRFDGSLFSAIVSFSPAGV